MTMKKTKGYRTVWVVLEDWDLLQGVAAVSGVSGSAMVSQAMTALRIRLEKAGVFKLVELAGESALVEQQVRERIAQVMQELAGAG
jgi:hypothetical protein